MSILGALLAAVLPAGIDVVKSVVSRVLYGQRALTVDDEVKLMDAESQKLKSLAELDKAAEGISKWVADARAIYRYVASTLIIVFTFILILSPSAPKEFTKLMLDLTSGVVFFLFGHRTWLSVKNSKK